MYKDPEKQREAVKLATRRYRAKGITKVSQEQGITGCDDVIPDYARPRPEDAALKQPKPQSYNPMMVGYVPPEM